MAVERIIGSLEEVDTDSLNRWVSSLPFSDAGLPVPTQAFSRRTISEQQYHKHLQDIIISGEEEVWENAAALLERKSVHTKSSYKHPPAQRILVGKLSAFFTAEEISEKLGLETSTCHNIINETCAALHIVQEQDMPNDVLSDSIRVYVTQISDAEKRRRDIKDISDNPEVLALRKELRALDTIFTSHNQHGAITPLLDDLDINPPANINSNISLFLLKRRRLGGALTLLRNVHYASWYNTEDTSKNLEGTNTNLFLKNLAYAAYSREIHKKEGTNASRRFEANTCHFLSYLAASEFNRFVQNNSVEDAEFQEMFPITPNNPWGNRGIIINVNNHSLNEVAHSRLSKFLLKGDYSRFYINPLVYYTWVGHGPSLSPAVAFAKDVVKKESSELIADISKTRGVKFSTARKIYDAGVNTTDYMLSACSSRIPGNYYKQVRPGPVVRAHNTFLDIISNETVEQKEGNEGRRVGRTIYSAEGS